MPDLLKRGLSGLVAFFRRAPLLVILTAVSVYCLPDGEFFPLSSFPMYSRNTEKTYVIYLRDADGNPIASERDLGVRTSILKKDYDRELTPLARRLRTSRYDMTAEQRRPAGQNVLEYLVTKTAPEQVRRLKTSSIELVDLQLERTAGHIRRREDVVGRVELKP